jgi:hypothetical protein
METPWSATMSGTLQPSWVTKTNGALLFVTGLIMVTLFFAMYTKERFRGTLIRGGG